MGHTVTRTQLWGTLLQESITGWYAVYQNMPKMHIGLTGSHTQYTPTQMD